MAQNSKDPSPTKAGWSAIEWAADAGLSRAYVYRLLADDVIRSVKVGSRRIIITPPREYLASLAAAQQAAGEAA